MARNRGHRVVALDASVDRLSFFTPQSKSIYSSNSPKNKALPSDQCGCAKWDGFLVVLEPPVLEDRIKNQESLFTQYISDNQNELVWNHREYIEVVEQYHSRQLLNKIVIPSSSKIQLKSALEKNGINPYHIFPDLAGLVMLLKQQLSEDINGELITAKLLSIKEARV